jgi:hypothetical protein
MQCTIEPASCYWPSIETLGQNITENQLYNEVAVTSDTEVFRSEAGSLQHQHLELQPASIDNVSSHISRSVDLGTPNDFGSAHGLPPAHHTVSGFKEDSCIWNITHSDSGWWGQNDSSVISPPGLSSNLSLLFWSLSSNAYIMMPRCGPNHFEPVTNAKRRVVSWRFWYNIELNLPPGDHCRFFI